MTADAPKPPVAPIRPHRVTLHGDERVDDYHWLRDKGNDDVLGHLQAEAEYTKAVMAPTAALQEQLFEEIKGRIEETDESVPVRMGDYYYYERTEEGKQYAIHARRKGSLDAPEEIILDENALAEGKPFLGLGVFAVSDDGNLLAYSIDTTGFREYTLHVKDLRSGALLPDTIEKVKSVVWAADGEHLFYTVDDHAKRSYRIHRHRLGDDGGDPLLYEEEDERFRIVLYRSRSKAYVFAASASHTTTEYRFLDATTPTAAWTLIAPREQDHEYYVSHRGDRFYIRTNDAGRTFRVATAPVEDPSREHWEEMIAVSPRVMIDGFSVFAGHYVVFEREDALPHIRVGDFATGHSHRIPQDEEAYSVGSYDNPELDTTSLLFSYQSFTTPRTIYEYDMATGARTLRKRDVVHGDFDPADYRTERFLATASDGTEVPVTLVARGAAPRDGSAPLLLRAYGSYGFPTPITFSYARLSLLDRGITVAVAHVRGGGEHGTPWHDQGRMFAKKNTFTDFIAVAEHLVAEGYTATDRLIAEGGSAGGLLMGAAANMRPDLFAIVLSHVPFVDVLNTMLDDTLPLTVGEYEEWGNPRVADEYEYMKSYCPYTNVRAQDYPTMLVKTSYNDSQVMYWEPAKYVAKLRACKTDDNLLLFDINMEGGHGGSSGRYDRIREVAFDFAFVLWQLGLWKPG